MRVFMLLLGLFLSFQLSGKDVLDVLQVNPLTRGLDLKPYIWVLPDPHLNLGIEEVSQAYRSGDFKKLSQTGNNFGLGHSAYWLRFAINVNKSVSDTLLLKYDFPMMDHVTLYADDGKGGFSISQSGDHHALSSRDIEFHQFLFRLSPVADKTQTYYLRLQNDGSMQVSLSLWTSFALIEHVDNVVFVLGIYYGSMLVLAIVAFVIFLTMRNSLFLSYFLFLSSFLFLQLSLNGLSLQYLWPDSPFWANRSPVFFLGLVVVFGPLFAAHFLRVWKTRPLLQWFFVAVMVAGFAAVIISLLGSYTLAAMIAITAGLLIVPLVFITTILSVRSGFRPALYFLAAWGVFLLGILITGMVYVGLLDSNTFSLYAMQAASTMNILLCGYAVIVSINQIYSDKEISISTVNRFLENLTDDLEAKVAERTRELKHKNDLLSDLALRDSMTGLLNHNTCIDHLNMLLKSARRYGHNLAVAMIDIDHFKSINDEHGHPVGDSVINAIADILKNSLRESDGCGRYGGEEFILLLPETSAQNAFDLCENIRLKIMGLKIPEIQNQQVTASFGISLFDQVCPKADLINEADKALYQAKENGRNQVVLMTTAADCNEAV